MAEYGTILVRVFTSRAQIPVVGATISITRKAQGGQHTLLAVRITDESGRIAPIPIAAPAPAKSQTPDGGQGFALCDVWAEHPEYQLLLVENVQIFPNVETVQDMALIPLAEHAIPRNEADVVEITPQPL